MTLTVWLERGEPTSSHNNTQVSVPHTLAAIQPWQLQVACVILFLSRLVCSPPVNGATHTQDNGKGSDREKEKRKKKKLRRQWKPLPHEIRKRSHFGTEYRKAPPPRKGIEKPMGIKRIAGLAWNRLLMRVDNSTGKGASSMDKFCSKVHRVHMELGGKPLYSLRAIYKMMQGSRFALPSQGSVTSNQWQQRVAWQTVSWLAVESFCAPCIWMCQSHW